jgi:hypothetical protein
VIVVVYLLEVVSQLLVVIGYLVAVVVWRTAVCCGVAVVGCCGNCYGRRCRLWLLGRRNISAFMVSISAIPFLREP